MTVQELIDELMKIEDKTKPVCCLGIRDAAYNHITIVTEYRHSVFIDSEISE